MDRHPTHPNALYGASIQEGHQPLLSALNDTSIAEPSSTIELQDPSNAPEMMYGAPSASEHEGADEGEDEDDGDHTGGGRGGGALSEPEIGPATVSGYSSDITRDLPRLPRASHRTPRGPLSFSGATACRPPSRNGRATEASGHKPEARVRPQRRDPYSREQRAHMAESDPLEWTGGSPPPAVPPAGPSFSLPPLLSDTNETRHNAGISPLKVLRCTSYCCSVGLDLLSIYRALAEGEGLICQMHKDGLNAVLHCVERNRPPDAPRHATPRDAHSFFFSYGCLVTWGLSEAEERARLRLLSESGCMQEPLSEHEVDDFGYVITETAKPSIAKDVVTLSSREVMAGPCAHPLHTRPRHTRPRHTSPLLHRCARSSRCHSPWLSPSSLASSSGRSSRPSKRRG